MIQNFSTVSIFWTATKKPFVYTGPKMVFDQAPRNVYGGYHDYIRQVLEIYYLKNRRHIVMFPQGSYEEFERFSRYKIQAIIDNFIQEYKTSPGFFAPFAPSVNQIQQICP